MNRYLYICDDAQIIKQIRFINNAFAKTTPDMLPHSLESATHGVLVIQHPDTALMRSIREKNSVIRIIYICSAADEGIDENLLLSQLSGYLKLPLDIDALHRAYTKASDEMGAFSQNNLYRLSNNYYWDRISKRLYDNKAIEVSLTTSQTKLFDLFIKKPNRPISEDALLSELYNAGINLKTSSLKNTISALRKKLAGIELTNIYGEGYRLSVSLAASGLNIISLNSLLEEIRCAPSLQALYERVCERLFHIYHAERAFITKQGLENRYIDVLYEVADTGYPGVYSLNQRIPVKAIHKEMLNFADSVSDPVTFDEKGLAGMFEEDREFWDQLPKAKSLLFYNFPHKGHMYSLGLHQVSYDRVWNLEEKIFLKNITKAFRAKLQEV